jgi:hypothetical protein
MAKPILRLGKKAVSGKLVKRIKAIQNEVVYGERQGRTFEEAATRIIEEHGHKQSLNCDIMTLNVIMPYIDDFAQEIHSASLDIPLVTKKPTVFLLVHWITIGLSFAEFYVPYIQVER